MNKDEDKTKPKKTPHKKVFDVTRPGKAPASATSRPVIVGHKPPVADDQFVPGANSRWASGDPLGKHDIFSPKKKLSVVAPSGVDANAKTAPEPVDEAPVEVVDETPRETPTRDDTPEPAAAPLLEEPTVPTEPPQETTDTAPVLDDFESLKKDFEFEEQPVEPTDKPSPEQLAVDQMVETPKVDPDPMPTDGLPEEQTAPKEAQGTADEDKPATQDDVLAATNAPLLDQVVVSHHKHHTKWWEWILIFLLIVALAAVALNFLLDAEVISTGIDLPHTNLFK